MTDEMRKKLFRADHDQYHKTHPPIPDGKPHLGGTVHREKKPPEEKKE